MKLREKRNERLENHDILFAFVVFYEFCRVTYIEKTTHTTIFNPISTLCEPTPTHTTILDPIFWLRESKNTHNHFSSHFYVV